jgi:hypothetical protein
MGMLGISEVDQNYMCFVYTSKRERHISDRGGDIVRSSKHSLFYR